MLNWYQETSVDARGHAGSTYIPLYRSSTTLLDRAEPILKCEVNRLKATDRSERAVTRLGYVQENRLPTCPVNFECRLVSPCQIKYSKPRI